MEDTHMHKNFAKTGLELRIFFAFSSHFLRIFFQRVFSFFSFVLHFYSPDKVKKRYKFKIRLGLKMRFLCLMLNFNVNSTSMVGPGGSPEVGLIKGWLLSVILLLNWS